MNCFSLGRANARNKLSPLKSSPGAKITFMQLTLFDQARMSRNEMSNGIWLAHPGFIPGLVI